ncbi:hypothetical protein Acsp06_48080 [Actinomycetospora sp. NBRC 106375]|uniref:hypothetical protein n=1 Tax=Actinomycetospora sp. NBRC 106375 TaxID=3032207 RepID=UPI0024A19050|nr:hypothetical protein [Actinomycetospora sp. NBRC 106375]GLZ48623.1 hypothetical protein Acsp06_48080 [Actinomycetospora sp. NBRC 106375]
MERAGTAARPRRHGFRRAALAGAVAGLALLAGACSSGPTLETPPIPTFPGPGAAPATSAPPPRNSILPTECDQVLASDQLPNYLGLPLGTVRVTALRDVPAPSVGRVERVTCNYTSLGGPGAPPPNTLVLKVLTSGYTSPEAAAAQSRVNRDAQASSGVPAQPVPFGAAEAVYYPDPEGPVLVVVYGRVTASFTLTPDRPVPVDQAQPVLTDLALRALPVLVPQAGQ